MPDLLTASDFGDCAANGTSVVVTIYTLPTASQQQAISVAAWLRNIALEVEDQAFRAKVDPAGMTYRYCQPLNAE